MANYYKYLVLASFILNSFICISQLDIDSTLGIPTGTTAEITAILPANLGSMAYSTDDNLIYTFNGTAWVPSGSDNLGNHIATQNIQTNGNWISDDGDDEGIFITNNGNVGISNVSGFSPARQFHVAGNNAGIRLDRYGSDAFFFFVNFNAAGTVVNQNWAFINNSLTGNDDFEIRNYGTAVGGTGDFTPFRIKTTNQLQLEAYGASTTFEDNTAQKILAVQNDGDVVQIDRNSLPYEKIVIWAEEGGLLANNSLEWSFGNSAVGRIGIPLPEDWEAYAVSVNSQTNGAGDSVEIAVTNSVTNTNLFTFTATAVGANNMAYTEILATPVAIPAGTSLGFRTVNVTGSFNNNRVAVFLRRRP